jgi:ribosomal-protein-alanine N-acetyltransferase
MPAESSPFIARGQLVGIRRPTVGDREEFVGLARGSVEFLRPWTDPPATYERFDEYLRGRQGAGDEGVLVCEIESGRIAGVLFAGFFNRRLWGIGSGSRLRGGGI